MTTPVPDIEDVSSILAADRPAGAKLRTLLGKYESLPTPDQREAFVAALAGEALLARAHLALLDPSQIRAPWASEERRRNRAIAEAVAKGCP